MTRLWFPPSIVGTQFDYSANVHARELGSKFTIWSSMMWMVIQLIIDSGSDVNHVLFLRNWPKCFFGRPFLSFFNTRTKEIAGCKVVTAVTSRCSTLLIVTRQVHHLAGTCPQAELQSWACDAENREHITFGAWSLVPRIQFFIPYITVNSLFAMWYTQQHPRNGCVVDYLIGNSASTKNLCDCLV